LQSSVLAFAQPLNVASADGQVEPSGQHCSPPHCVLVAGHITVSPTLHILPGKGDGGEGGGGEGIGGEGEGGPGFTQSSVLGLGQHPKASAADGHVEPSGQQVLPLQPTPVPGQITGSPTWQVPGLSRNEEGASHHHASVKHEGTRWPR